VYIFFVHAVYTSGLIFLCVCVHHQIMQMIEINYGFAAEPDSRTSSGAHGLLLLASAVDAAENTRLHPHVETSAPQQLDPAMELSDSDGSLDSGNSCLKFPKIFYFPRQYFAMQ
jgi:hypothetical protein